MNKFSAYIIILFLTPSLSVSKNLDSYKKFIQKRNSDYIKIKKLKQDKSKAYNKDLTRIKELRKVKVKRYKVLEKKYSFKQKNIKIINEAEQEMIQEKIKAKRLKIYNKNRKSFSKIRNKHLQITKRYNTIDGSDELNINIKKSKSNFESTSSDNN